MLPFERIPLGEWLPDQPAYPNPGAIEVRNAIPQAGSYRSFNAFSANTGAAGSLILNAIWVEFAGSIEVIAGTTTTLLRLSGGSWSTVGSGYSVTSWEFARFGSQVIAVAPGQAPQIIDLSVGSPAFSSITGTPENPPNARRIGIVRDFVMLGNLDSEPDVIQWSGYNNATIWDDGGSTQYQADAQILFTGGDVQKIIGGPFGYVFQEREIKAVEYIGPPPVFNIQTLDRERGAISGDSVVAAGDRVFFLAQDGFYMIVGGQFTPIGAERVNRWFLDEVDSAAISEVVGAVDRRNTLVVWGFKTDATASVLQRLLIYNYTVDRWAYADVSADNITNLVELRNVGYTLDTLDTILPGGPDVDSITVESPAYVGGALLLFATGSGGTLGTFTGDAKQAVIDTAEFDGGQNLRRSITNVRPLVEGDASTSITVSVGARDSLRDTPTFTAAQALNSVDEAPILSDARYHRIRLTVEDGFDHANGVDVMSRPSGRF
jgi:hypothetical protein